MKDPLPFELTIDNFENDAGVNGTVFMHFDQSFEKFIVPPFGTANSGTFGNVTLTQGATDTLAIIPLGELDILNANVQLRQVASLMKVLHLLIRLILVPERAQSVTI